ncbi:Tryptase-2 [Temnothorax longispinosus]|uniref:Tryptase-2 n=1 Tax=Temnothorax longispinosus TaxID=300112 RepID=A0A4S2JPP0_9HYME|nr:Tryptase-2 [Temnothorax longispinosus]
MLLAVVVVLIPYICPISLVTGIETTAWESAADEAAAAAAAVRIVGGEITSIKNYPFIRFFVKSEGERFNNK